MKPRKHLRKIIHYRVGPLVARFRKTGTDNPAATATTGQDGKYSLSTESRQGLYTVMASKEATILPSGSGCFPDRNSHRDITLTPLRNR